MGLISQLTPLNLKEEKAKFLAEFSYNPQFVYASIIDKNALTKYGLPQQKLYEFSLENIRTKGLPTSETLNAATQTDIIHLVDTFNHLHQLNPPVELVFSENQTARCQMGNGKIKFRLPIAVSTDDIQGVIDHELNTHFLRSYNNKLQPWFESEVRVDEHIRRTEEGLAQFNGYLSRPNKYSYKASIMYIAAYLAQHHSFAEIVAYLQAYELNPDYIWSIVVRVKRGMTDTSLPGGFTKDITYLEGMLDVYDFLVLQNNDPHDLYLGKLAITDIPNKKPIAQTDNLIYPSFIQNNDHYKTVLVEIAKANNFDQLLTN